MSQPDQRSLSQDEVYDLLSNARRRYVISYLRDRDEPVSVSDLSTAVAAWENEVDPEELTDQQVKRLYVSLYQTHLPKLDDAGLIDYDQDDGRVQLESTVAELDTYLPGQEQSEIPWQLVYGGLAVAALVLYLVVALTPSNPFGLTPGAFGAVTILAFAVVAGAHYVLHRREGP